MFISRYMTKTIADYDENQNKLYQRRHNPTNLIILRKCKENYTTKKTNNSKRELLVLGYEERTGLVCCSSLLAYHPTRKKYLTFVPRISYTLQQLDEHINHSLTDTCAEASAFTKI